MPKISKNVKALGLVSLFTDISTEMIKPILPIFLVSVLGASPAVVGLIEGFAESTAAILKVFSGYISDKLRKRKSLIGYGYLLSTVSKPLLALSSVWGHVFGLRIIDRVGKGVRDAPRDALIAESSDHMGGAFGYHRMLDTLGAVIGILISAYILSQFIDSFRMVFWLATIPGIISVLIVVFYVKEKKKNVRTKKVFKFSFKELSRNYKRFLITAVLFNFANISYAFYILKAQEVGIAVALVPIIYLVYNIVYAGFAYPIGNLSDKVGKKKIVVIGYLVFALTCLGFAYASAQWLVWVLFGIAGIGVAITESVPKAFISDLIESDKRGTALGIYNAMTGIAILPASVVAGLLWNNFSSHIAFMYCAVIASIAGIIMFVIVRD